MGARLTRMAALGAFALLASVWALAPVQAEETPFVIPVNKLCGVDSYHAPNTLSDCQVQDARNVLFDEDAAAKMREGFVTYLTLATGKPVRGLWAYRAPDGTDWLLGLSSSTLYGYNRTSTSTLISGLNPDARMDCAPCLGSTYCTDRSTNVFTFNGSSITYDTGAPMASLVECWRNRVILADVSGEQSTVYLSGELNGTDWTPALASTAPVTWRVGGVNDAGNRIKCMKAGFADVLFLGTPGNTWAFTGNDQRDFQLNSLFSDVGCLDDGTVQEHMGELTWVSNKGVERFDRNVLQYPRVSEPIRNVTDALSASAAQELSWVQTTQSDFEAGTSSGTSVTLDPGNVVLNTWTHTDTSDADFNTGTLNDVTVNGDRIYLSTNNTNVQNESFEFGSSNWSGAYGTPSWVLNPGLSAGFTTCGAIPAYDGSWLVNRAAGSGRPLYFKIWSAAGSLLSSTNVTPPLNCSWQTGSKDLSAWAGRWIVIGFDANGSTVGTDAPFLCSGGTIEWHVAGYTPASSPLYDSYAVDLVTGGRSTIYSGTFTSPGFDATSYSSAAWLASDANWTANGHTISAQTQSSSDGSIWQAGVAWSTGSPPASDYRRYIRYVLTISTGGTTNGTALPYVDDVTLSARAADGTFVSQAHDVTGATAWGNFESNQTTSGGTISYFTRSSTTEAGLESEAWHAQTPFTTIAAPVNPWVQYRADFVATSSASVPAHHDATIFWRSGANSPALSSVVFRDRYHLFYTTSTASDASNDSVAVLDRNKVWTFFDGINAASSVMFGNNVLVGDAAASGKIFRLYSGYNDNGSAISAYVKMRDMAADNFEDAEQIWSKFYVTLGHETISAQDVNVNVSYTVDGDDETFSLGAINLDENVGRIVARVPFQIGGTNLNIGRWISPRLSWSALDAPVSFYGLRLYGFKQDVQ